MTEQERIIVSAYTGCLICDFGKVHEYIEKKMGRAVWTHEMALENIQKEIREKCRDDFVALAREDQTETTELLTDTEQRIFLIAIAREREVCKKVHEATKEWTAGTTINLVKVCDEIKRKVMRGEKSRPKGRWGISSNGDYVCSVCGAKECEFIYGTEMWYGKGESNFCPNCGAEMRGEI